MAYSTGRQPLMLLSFTMVCMVILAMVGCSGDNHQTTIDTHNSGQLQVRLVWQTRNVQFAAMQVPPSGDVCDDFLISHVRVRVVGAGDAVAAESDLIRCSLGETRLDGIPAGGGYRVEVEGMVGDQVHWFGQRTDVEVIAGQTTAPIEVEMNYQGDPDASPTAVVDPADTAVNVSPQTPVTVRFSKEVVPASVSDTSILVHRGSDAVAGQVSYDPATFEATFVPDAEFAVSSTYTVTVTVDVMDRIGQPMDQPVTCSFTTTRVWFVDAALPAAGMGTSWADGFQTVDAALNAAAIGEQIWVKAGTYVLGGQLVVGEAVELLGGFAGTETQHHQRDHVANPTEIDGDGQGRCFVISSAATVDGFTITGGSLAGQNSPEGGAMFIDGASPHILNCIFNNNLAGPSDGFGGAIYISGGDPRIDGCSFIDNNARSGTSGYGGAIYNFQGGPAISGCLFKGNRATGGFGNFGGAIYNSGAKPTTTITDCRFISNTAGGEVGGGGAIYNGGSGGSPVLISGCIFKYNTCGGLAGIGGAIQNINSDVRIENSSFIANNSSGAENAEGGAIDSSFSTVVIANCSFAFNTATTGLPDTAFGGAVSNRSSSNVTITNSILWDNEAQTDNQVFTDASSSVTIAYCNIAQYISGGNNNMSERPRLGADLHLRAGSPGMDRADGAAAPAVDMDGETRPQGASADMGADEFLDSDGDRLPDYWETRHGVADPAADGDSDLVPAISEYHLGTDPGAANPVMAASHRGTVRSDGTHQAADLSTPTGATPDGTHHAFFVFDVSGAASPITAANLRLELVGYNSDAIPERFQIWDVGPTTAAQLAVDTSGQAGIDIYTDLGGGTLYAEFAPTPSDEGAVLDIQLNRAALSAMNLARTGSGEFIIGLRLRNSGTGHLLFSQAAEARVHQLVLVVE